MVAQRQEKKQGAIWFIRGEAAAIAALGSRVFNDGATCNVSIALIQKRSLCMKNVMEVFTYA